MYEVTFRRNGILHKQTVNAGSTDEAYYTISGLYPTDKITDINVRKIEM